MGTSPTKMAHTALWLVLCVLPGTLSYIPVIGIAAEPTAGNDKPALKKLGTSLLAASYVKWIEAAGARVVPLQFDLSEDQLLDRYKQINGVLFPGGGSSINDNSSYAVFSRKLFAWSVRDKLPVWGTCLGFEQLMVYSSTLDPGAGTRGVLSNFDSEALFIPLNLTQASGTSKLFSSAPPSVVETLSTKPVTANLHSSGVSPRSLDDDAKLRAAWSVVATNVDRVGKEFVSLAEGRHLPLYASQFHPEKNAFEFDQTWDSPAVAEHLHASDAIQASSWFARFFVDQVRQNSRRFASKAAFFNASIYNYNPIYTDKMFPGQDLWEQAYVF